MDILDSHIKTLERDGVVILENAISSEELEYLHQQYSSGWREIIDNFSTLNWKQIKFNPDCQINMGFIGKDLYDGHHMAEYKSTGILDMSNSRYDFTYGLENVKIQSNDVNYIMKKMLKNEYNSYLGGLPILNNVDYPKQNRNGKWHRDAYSLFDNETLDMTLPPFYYTVLIPYYPMRQSWVIPYYPIRQSWVIPLFTMQSTSGRNTEFIPGSHRINLAKQGITNSNTLNEWCSKQETIKLNCKPGDVCIFHGYTIHRGVESNNAEQGSPRKNNNSDNSDLLYAVYKKNWYNDEPADNYLT